MPEITPATATTPGPPDVESPTAVASPPQPAARPVEDLVEADLLVEDVSIDGMCGVY